MSFDITSLPPPRVIEELSFEAIRDEMLADLAASDPTYDGLVPSDPGYKIIEVAAARELLLRARYNDEARALLLAYAAGTDLDHIGATYYDGEARLVITPANPNAVPPIDAVYESDDDYRLRLQNKPESYSTAGPREAYEWYAVSASGQVRDAKADSPTPGTTTVYVLSRTGDGAPDQALLGVVEVALSAETVRPLSEEVLVAPAQIQNYALDVDLYVYAGPAQEPLLAAAQAALDKLAADAHALKGYVARSAIDAAAHVAGVQRVVINSPAADIACTVAQAPYCTAVNVRIAGVV